jgi:hypothetical protein
VLYILKNDFKNFITSPSIFAIFVSNLAVDCQATLWLLSDKCRNLRHIRFSLGLLPHGLTERQ